MRGFRVTLITQRPAVLHKNCLSQASTLVAMRLPAPQDRKAIEDWIKGQADVEKAAEVLGSLSKLERGEGWVWAPEQDVLLRTVFPMIETFDSMRTPEHGEALGEPTRLAPVELGDLRALMTAEEDEKEADRPAGSATAADIEAARQEGWARGIDEGRKEGWTLGYRSAVDDIERALADRLADFRNDAATIKRTFPKSRSASISAPTTQPEPESQKNTVVARQPVANGSLPPSAAKLLAVLARGLRLTWTQTATLAGLKARGGSFNTARKALREGGYIAEDGEAVAATDSGFEAAGGRQPVPSGPAELLAWWRASLPQTSSRILDQVCRQGGKWIAKDRLAGFLGVAPRGGSWNTALSILRQNGLIEIKGDKLRAAAALREGGGAGNG